MGAVFINCPYQSKVSMGQANMSIDKGLLGKWKTSRSKRASNKSYTQITANGTRGYNLVQYTWSSSRKKFTTKNYTAHLVNYNGVKWLNVLASRKWVTYKLTKKSNNEYLALPLSSNIQEKFNNSNSFKSFIGRHMNLSFFYSYSDKKNYYRFGPAPQMKRPPVNNNPYGNVKPAKLNCSQEYRKCRSKCRKVRRRSQKTKCYRTCGRDRRQCAKDSRYGR